MMRRSSGLTAVVIVFAALLGNGKVAANQQAEKEALQASSRWLALLDEGQFASSWDHSAQLFKGAITKDQWEKTLTSVRTPLGRLVSRKIKSRQYATSLPGAPDGEYVVIQYQTSFQNKATASETVTPMRDPDGKWRVSGYFVK
jgi:hypothetical protein